MFQSVSCTSLFYLYTVLYPCMYLIFHSPHAVQITKYILLFQAKSRDNDISGEK